VTWTSVRVWPDAVSRDLVTQVLFDHGSQALQDDGPCIVTCFPDEAVAGVRVSLEQALPGTRVEITPLPDVDWSERWKDQARLHRVGRVTIAPPWLVDHVDAASTIVTIEPAMAFGTGDHPTTRRMLGLMQVAMAPGDFVADLGAGSAVLSIVAAKLGASRVAAIEIDGEAIGNAEENVRRNDVADRVQVLHGDANVFLPLLAPLRVIVANIISSVLVELLPAMDSALTADGAMILSGILHTERTQMLAVLDGAGWVPVGEDTEGEWWAVSLRRAAS